MREIVDRFIVELESVDEKDLDKILDTLDNIKSKTKKFIEKARGKNKEPNYDDIKSHLSELSLRMKRVKTDSYDRFVRHVDILCAKIVGDLNKLAKCGTITVDELEIYLSDIESWINTPSQRFSLADIKEELGVLMSRFIDGLGLKEDDING